MEAHGRDLSGTQGDCHGAVKDGGGSLGKGRGEGTGVGRRYTS